MRFGLYAVTSLIAVASKSCPCLSSCQDLVHLHWLNSIFDLLVGSAAKQTNKQTKTNCLPSFFLSLDTFKKSNTSLTSRPLWAILIEINALVCPFTSMFFVLVDLSVTLFELSTLGSSTRLCQPIRDELYNIHIYQFD